MATTMTLICYELSRDHVASVHRTGCKDIARDHCEHGGHCQEVAGTAADAVAHWLGSVDQEGDPANLGYTADHVKVHNCTKRNV